MTVNERALTVDVPVLYGADNVTDLAIDALEDAGYSVESVRATIGNEFELTATKGRVSGYVFTTNTIEYAELSVKLAGAWDKPNAKIIADKQYVKDNDTITLTITYDGTWSDNTVRTGNATVVGGTLSTSSASTDGTPVNNTDDFTGLKVDTITDDEMVITFTI